MKIPRPDNPYHVENLNSIALLEAQGFEGQDESIETSIFEYGIAWKDLGDETLFIYGIKVNKRDGYHIFDRCTFKNDTDPQKEWNLIDWDPFLNYWRPYFMQLDFQNKVCELFSFYGYEEIFGASYWEGFKITK